MIPLNLALALGEPLALVCLLGLVGGGVLWLAAAVVETRA